MAMSRFSNNAVSVCFALCWVGAVATSWSAVSTTNLSDLQEVPVATVAAADSPDDAKPLCDADYKAGHYQQALQHCTRLLERVIDSGEKKDSAVVQYRIGRILIALNQQEKALRALRQSQQDAVEAGAPVLALYALNRQGTVYHRMGDPAHAIAAYSEALALVGVPESNPSLVHTRANRGAAYYQVGKYSEALNDLQFARVAYDEIRHKAGRTSAHINLALVHQALGDFRFAQSEFEQALEIAKASPGDDRRTAEALHNLGFLAENQKDSGAARDHYQEALNYYRSDDPGRSTTLNNLGVSLGELGEYDAATQRLDEALTLARQNRQRAVEGRTLDSLATVQAYQDLHTEALGNFQRALIIEQETADREGQRMTLANIGKQLHTKGQLALATVFYKRSVNVAEAIRNDLKSLSGSHQRSYTSTVEEIYRELSSLLLQQNRLLEAQRVIDLLKVQELDDYLGDVRGNEENADGVPQTSAEQEIFEEYDALAARAVAIGRDLALMQETPRDERSAEQVARMDELESLQQQLNDEFVRFIESREVRDAVERLQGRIGDEAIELTTLKKIGNKLKELNHPAVVLYPLILDDRLELILATPESRPIHRSVNVSRQELRSTVLEFRTLLRDPTADATGPAKQLYDWLIRPFERELMELETEAILYAPDGALRYVPLAAFHDGDNWLIQRFRINNWTSASSMDLSSTLGGEIRIIGGAYTTGDYSFTIANQLFRFLGLPYAGKEMETLSASFEGTLWFNGEKFVFDDIYRERSAFNVLHLATHAAAVVGQPSDSFILFGDGGRKSIQDIKSLDFDFDLAVLSACETAVGETMNNGVEVLGLGYALQQSGARATVASLWRVSDGGTHALMNEFYRQLKAGKAKAKALQLAQQFLIANDEDAIASANRGLVLDRNVASRLSHPYYWAPFIIVGSGL